MRCCTCPVWPSRATRTCLPLVSQTWADCIVQACNIIFYPYTSPAPLYTLWWRKCGGELEDRNLVLRPLVAVSPCSWYDLWPGMCKSTCVRSPSVHTETIIAYNLYNVFPLITHIFRLLLYSFRACGFKWHNKSHTTVSCTPFQSTSGLILGRLIVRKIRLKGKYTLKSKFHQL